MKKKSFFITGKKWPGQGHHEVNQEPCPGWYYIDARHYLYWQRWAHPMLTRHGEGRRVPARILPLGAGLTPGKLHQSDMVDRNNYNNFLNQNPFITIH